MSKLPLPPEARAKLHAFLGAAVDLGFRCGR
jgi:hypothetical protein